MSKMQHRKVLDTKAGVGGPSSHLVAECRISDAGGSGDFEWTLTRLSRSVFRPNKKPEKGKGYQRKRPPEKKGR